MIFTDLLKKCRQKGKHNVPQIIIDNFLMDHTRMIRGTYCESCGLRVALQKTCHPYASKCLVMEIETVDEW